MNYDTEWHYVGEVGEPEFKNGAKNWASLMKVRFMKGADGIVRIEGRMSDAVFSQPAWTLPEDYLSDEVQEFMTVMSNGNPAFVQIEGGNIRTDCYYQSGIGTNLNISYFVGPVVGLAGVKGDKGDIGPGFEDYDPLTTYGKRAVVGHTEKAFLSKVENNESDPGENNDWEDMKGEKGDIGSLDSGLIMAWPTDTPPTGWAFCNGQELNRIIEAGLFDVIGTDHGEGDGVDTFNVPDYEGVFLRGAGSHGSMTKADGNPFAGGTVGDENDDKMQQLTGNFNSTTRSAMPTPDADSSFSGALKIEGTSRLNAAGNSGGLLGGDTLTFDSSLSTAQGGARTGDETAPASKSVNWIIKL